MIVSLLRECRPGELRVLLLPQDIGPLCEICDLHVETGAGRGLGIPDDAYARAGARITSSTDAWEKADFLLKLKASTLAEVRRIGRGTSIAALFHAEGTRDIVAGLLGKDITAYSFEYFQDDDGTFPLMAATGEIAGQMAVIYAAYHLQSHLGGSGVSLPACTQRQSREQRDRRRRRHPRSTRGTRHTPVRARDQLRGHRPLPQQRHRHPYRPVLPSSRERLTP